MKLLLAKTFYIFLLLIQAFGQTQTAGVILPPEEFGPTYTCCVAIPQTGFTLYEEARENSIAGCILPGKAEGTSEHYGYETLPESGDKMLKLEDMHRISYEVYGLTFLEDKNGFVRINDKYWIQVAEVKKQNFSLAGWMDFLLKNSGNVMGFYANEPGLNLRKGVGTNFEKIVTMKGDEMEISLTGEVDGLWAKVKVKQYKEHPCNFMEEGEPKALNTYEGWAKVLDDTGTPNLHYYAAGC